MNRNSSNRVVYAWLMRYAADVNLTWDQALSTLGLPLGSTPSKSEIQSAYRTMARKHHPDLGGDADKMVVVNVAKDILDGTRRPSAPAYTRPPAPTPRPAYTRPQEPAYEKPYERSYTPPPRNDSYNTTTTFAEALQGTNFPSGLKWQFITEMLRYSKNYMADESSVYIYGYVAFGVTDTHAFYAAITHDSSSTSYSGYTSKNVWNIGGEVKKIGPNGINPKEVITTIKTLAVARKLDKPVNPKVIKLDENWTPTEAFLRKIYKGDMTMPQFFIEKGLAKAPASKSKPAPVVKIKLAYYPMSYLNNKETPSKYGIMVGNDFYELAENPNTARLQVELYWRVTKNNYTENGYYSKELSRVRDSNSIAQALLKADDSRYISPPLTDTIRAALQRLVK